MKCFDPFRLDVANQCLWQGRVRVALMPKPFDVLTYLVQNSGRLITQDELLRAVWPGTYVQPDVLRKHIKEIRRVLGDVAAKPQFIETLPKRGYRFIAPVLDQSASTVAAAGSRVASTLVGRDSVFAALDQRLSRALAGERQVVFLTGEAGIGKSSVVAAFERRVSVNGQVRTAWGQSVEGFGGKEPYYPLLEAFGRLGRGPEGPPIVDALAACAPTWLVQLPSLLPSERRAALAREAVGATTPRMVRELCEVLEAITRSTPLALVLEDLHWADHSTVDALSAVARRREPARLLIIGTYRPASVILGNDPFKDLRRDLCVHGLAHELALDPLSEADVARYIGESFSPNAFTPGLEAVLYRHSGGNPLFMAATLEHLVQRRALKWDGACWRISQPLEAVEPEVPETLRHLLELQLEQLADAERQALMAASVAGERFSTFDVETMLTEDCADVGELFEALASRGQILRAAAGGLTDRGHAATYEFKHALYRDTLYRGLPAARRITWHRRLGESLDARRAAGHDDLAGEVAEHYEAAGVYDRAVTATMLAAQNALRRYAHAEALALLTHAAGLNQRTHDAILTQRDVDLHQCVGDVRYAHGEMPAAADAYERAAAVATDRRLWAAAAQALLRAARSAVFFDVQRALAACERAARVAVEGGMPPLEARARLVGLCWDLLHRGWSRKGAGEAAAAFQRLLQSPADLAPADHILYANLQVFRSEYTDACARADTALLQLRATDTLWEYLGAIAAKAGALSLLGRWGEAYATLSDGIELARRNDNGPWIDILTGLLGSVHIQACDFAGARRVVTGRLPVSMAGGGSRPQMHLMVVSAGAELGLGNIREAIQRFSAVRANMPGDLPIVHWYWRLQAQLGLAEAALACGEPATANDHVSELTEAVSALDETMIAALAWECRARTHLAVDAPDLADASIERALVSLARFHVPGAAWRVHATAAAIRRVTDPRSVDSHLERARDVLTALASSLDGHVQLRQSLLASPAARALVGSS